VSLPSLSATCGGLVVSVTLAQTTGLLSSGGETAGFAVLVNGVDDPVDASITADGLVLRVNEDDLEVLVGRVLVDPVRVQNTQIGASATNTFFSGGLEGSLVLKLVNTLVGWFSYIEESYQQPFSKQNLDSRLKGLNKISVPNVAPFATGFLRPPRRTRTR